MASIDLVNLDKVYDNGFHAVRAVSLQVRDREFMVLVGPSGCGKTTCLRAIAGLESITGGSIHIGARRVDTMPPKERDIAMVFQNYALYPHMTVAENMGFGLLMRKMPRASINATVTETATLLGLADQLGKRPRELSGGQRQRVALGRAIVRHPQAFLFDEPLSNLDAKLRSDMRYELKTLQRRLATTTVYVTHDQIEAMTLGDRITVMNGGRIQQVGTPREVYDSPANRFVAAFIGTPAMNLIDGQLVVGDGLVRFCASGAVEFTLPHAASRLPGGIARWSLGIRPELLRQDDRGNPMSVTLVESMGDHQYVYLQAPGLDQVLVMKSSGPPLEPGAQVRIAIDPARTHLFAGVDDDAGLVAVGAPA